MEEYGLSAAAPTGSSCGALLDTASLACPSLPMRVESIMRSICLTVSLWLSLQFSAFAADLPSIPTEPVAKKKELLFSDDFERAELGKAWAIVVPTYSLENGTLKGTQMRFDAAAANGTPAVKGHQAVIGHDIPTKDSVIEFRFKLGGAQSVTAEFDDRKFNGSHYGHICMARIAAKGITLTDQKGLAVARPEGATGEPPTPAGRKNVTFPLNLDPATWHTFVLETVGDTMRASIDGKPVSYLKSPGIAHPTKSKVEFGCMGKDGFFDDLRIWNAEPVAK